MTVSAYTYNDELAKLNDVRDELSRVHAELVDSVKRVLMKHFTDAGGCVGCGGRGWVAAVPTGIDNESIFSGRFSYEECKNPACTPATREKSGLAPRYSMFDKAKGVRNPITESIAFKAIVGPIDESLMQISRRLEELSHQKNNYTAGDEVVIIVGDEPMVGTVWKVSRVHQNGGLLLKPTERWENAEELGTWVKRDRVAKLYKEPLK